MPEENIRTYTFNVPGFIPGVPGTWPAGSKVTINEDTKEVLNIWPQTFLASFAERLGDDAEVNQPVPDAPPAVSDPAQQLSDAVANL